MEFNYYLVIAAVLAVVIYILNETDDNKQI